MWQSGDPALGKYLDGRYGKGGIYNSMNLGLYTYTHQNPIIFLDPDGRVVIEGGFGLSLVVKGGFGFELSFKYDTESHEVGAKVNATARVGLEIGANLVGKISPSSGEPARSGEESEFFANASGGVGPFVVEQDIGSVKLSGPNKGQATGVGDVAAGAEFGDMIKIKPALKFGASAGSGVRSEIKSDRVARAVESAKQFVSGVKDGVNSALNSAERAQKRVERFTEILKPPVPKTGDGGS